MLRWLLGLVLIWAALSKLANVQEFYGNLLAYQLPLPDALVRWVAPMLPWLELLCGLLLLTRMWTEAALVWALTLFVVFVAATGQAWARDLEISCGCLNFHLLGLDNSSGVGLRKILESVTFAFFRAIFLLAGAVYLLRDCVRQRKETSAPA